MSFSVSYCGRAWRQSHIDLNVGFCKFVHIVSSSGSLEVLHIYCDIDAFECHNITLVGMVMQPKRDVRDVYANARHSMRICSKSRAKTANSSTTAGSGICLRPNEISASRN